MYDRILHCVLLQLLGLLKCHPIDVYMPIYRRGLGFAIDEKLEGGTHMNYNAVLMKVWFCPVSRPSVRKEEGNITLWVACIGFHCKRWKCENYGCMGLVNQSDCYHPNSMLVKGLYYQNDLSNHLP